MPICLDMLPLSEASSQLNELADAAAAGAEKVLTNDHGLPYVAIIDAKKLDYYHALEAEHGRLVMLDDAANGLNDVLAGRVQTEDELRGASSRKKSST